MEYLYLCSAHIEAPSRQRSPHLSHHIAIEGLLSMLRRHECWHPPQGGSPAAEKGDRRPRAARRQGCSVRISGWRAELRTRARAWLAHASRARRVPSNGGRRAASVIGRRSSGALCVAWRRSRLAKSAKRVPQVPSFPAALWSVCMHKLGHIFYEMSAMDENGCDKNSTAMRYEGW